MTDKALEAALPGEAEVVAWRCRYYDLNERLTDWGYSEDENAARCMADEDGEVQPLVTLASLQTMQARAEKAERERDEYRAKNAVLAADGIAARNAAASNYSRAEAAEARVKELEEQSALVSETLQSVINCPQGDLWNYATTPTAKERLIWAARVEVATEISALMPALKGGSNG